MDHDCIGLWQLGCKPNAINYLSWDFKRGYYSPMTGRIFGDLAMVGWLGLYTAFGALGGTLVRKLLDDVSSRVPFL